MKRALFLDRDGVINVDHGYVFKKENINFLNGIFGLVKEANKKNYLVIVVTNQAGIGRGLYSENDFLLLSEWIKKEFKKNKSIIDQIYYSPFHPTFGIGKYKVDSELRKPKPGMFFQARDDYQIDLENSIMIGDSETDLIAADRAGIKNIICLGNLIKNKYGLNINYLSEAEKYLSDY